MSTYWVALCEDEAVERGQITDLCQDILATQGVEAEIVPFSSADELRQAAEGKRIVFDLYLLDIQMEGTTGLELARQLYDQGVRDRVIFITGNPEYALAGYDAQPLHYLLKPVSRERLAEALGRALEKQGAQAVLFQRGGKAVPLPAREIRYLESRNHGTVVCRSLSPLSQELSGQFVLGRAGHPRRGAAEGWQTAPHEPNLLF